MKGGSTKACLKAEIWRRESEGCVHKVLLGFEPGSPEFWSDALTITLKRRIVGL